MYRQAVKLFCFKVCNFPQLTTQTFSDTLGNHRHPERPRSLFEDLMESSSQYSSSETPAYCH